MKRTQIQGLVLSHINRAIALVATSGLMTLVACSSSAKTVGAAQAQNTQSQPAAAQPVAGNGIQPATPLLKPVSAVSHKSPVQHAASREALSRDAMNTFKDDDFGISLDYPWQYGFKSGHKLRLKGEEVQTGFVAGEASGEAAKGRGVNLATIDIPAGYYDKTDFERAFMNVNVNRKLTPEQCGQFAGSSDNNAKLTPAKVKIGDQEYTMTVQKSDNSTLRTYHTYQGGACYEFVLGLETNNNDSSDAGEQIKPVSAKQVFARLEKIMETVTFEADPEASAVAAAPAATELPQKP